jgi:diacylglycerol O-acyltransferase / wax synthase
MARERMTGVDTAWLRMDSPVNLMMITGVEIFDKPMSYSALARVLRKRLLQWDRFKQKVVEDATGYWWVDDKSFDLANHLVRDRLPGKGGDAELKALVGRLAAEPLAPTARCGSSGSSRTTTARTRASSASTTASPTASRWWA